MFAGLGKLQVFRFSSLLPSQLLNEECCRQTCYDVELHAFGRWPGNIKRIQTPRHLFEKNPPISLGKNATSTKKLEPQKGCLVPLSLMLGKNKFSLTDGSFGHQQGLIFVLGVLLMQVAL